MPIVYQHIHSRWLAERSVETTIGVGRRLEADLYEGEVVEAAPSRGVQVATQLEKEMILQRSASGVIEAGRSLDYIVDASQVTERTPSRGVSVESAMSRTLIANQAPVADLVLTNNPRTRSVTADASGSSDPEGDGLTYDYYWGDGTTSMNAGPSETHQYPNATETYTVTVEVTDEHGKSDVAVDTATLYYPEVVISTIGGSDNSLGVSVSLDNEGDYNGSDLVHIDFYIDGVFDGDVEGQFIGSPAPHLTTYTYSGLSQGTTYALSCELFLPYTLTGEDFTTGTTSDPSGGMSVGWYPEHIGTPRRWRLVSGVSNGNPPYTYSWQHIDGTTGSFINGTNASSANPELQFASQNETTWRLTVTDAAMRTESYTLTFQPW